MKQYLKYLISCILNVLLKIFYIFPIKNNYIFFISGNIYGCNLKPIFENLYNSKSLNNKYIWCLKNREYIPRIYKKNTIVVRNNSLAFVYYFMRSRVIITNGGFPSYVPKRKSQVFINTWHGGGSYKSVDPNKQKNQKKYFVSSTLKSSKEVDYFVSSSKGFTEAISNDLFIQRDKFINIGMPRNDIFFNPMTVKELSDRVRAELEIGENMGIILYAPTYRGESNTQESVSEDLDIKAILASLQKRFNKPFQLLLREHPPIKPTMREYSIDVTSYIDIQPLLCAADVFITDFSSCMWDFSLTYKPGFLFVPDLNDYIANRGIKTSIDTWPFPYAQTNGELCKLIENYNESEAINKIKRHHEYLVSYETGNATKEICSLISKL